MRVFVTGGSGFIGQPLIAALRRRGDHVIALSRRDPVAGADESVLDQARVAECDAVIHLAGEPIAGHRLNDGHKQRVLDSRVDGTARVVAAMAARPQAVLVCASGADYYPFDESDRPYAESAAPGDTFLARVCVAWERAAEAAPGRRVFMRTGIVLGKGGALAKMALAFKAFAGGPLGSGRQWLSWVHIDDVVDAYLHAVDDDAVRGAVNLVAPEAVRQREFAQALGRALHRPAWFPTPAFALRAAVGELAEYLLHGRRVVPDALVDGGFRFGFPHLASALAAAV